MALKAVVDSLDGVEDAIQGLYTEAEDGKYYLSVDGVDALPQVRGLVTTLRRFKEVAPDASRLKSKLDRLSELEGYADLGLSADEVREALDELEALKAGGAGSEKLEELKATLEQQWQRKLDAQKRANEKAIESLTAERDQYRTALERREIDGGFDAALAKCGGTGTLPGELRDAAKALLMRKYQPKVVWDGDEPKGIVETDLGEVDIETFVETWSRTDSAAPFMPASGNKGSGAGGGKGGGSARANPFKTETRNLSEQMRLVKENPTLARQLAAEAGVKLPNVA